MEKSGKKLKKPQPLIGHLCLSGKGYRFNMKMSLSNLYLHMVNSTPLIRSVNHSDCFPLENLLRRKKILLDEFVFCDVYNAMLGTGKGGLSIIDEIFKGSVNVHEKTKNEIHDFLKENPLRENDNISILSERLYKKRLFDNILDGLFL